MENHTPWCLPLRRSRQRTSHLIEQACGCLLLGARRRLNPGSVLVSVSGSWMQNSFRRDHDMHCLLVCSGAAMNFRLVAGASLRLLHGARRSRTEGVSIGLHWFLAVGVHWQNQVSPCGAADKSGDGGRNVPGRSRASVADAASTNVAV